MVRLIQLFLVIVISPIIQSVVLIITSAQTISLAQWSPDGGHITYLQYHDGTSALYRTDANGSNFINLTSNVPGRGHIWSPDLSQIAYTVYENQIGVTHIYVMNADGSQNRHLIDRLSVDAALSWSPDGRRILGSSSDEVFLINPDGSNFTLLASGDAVGHTYSWSPQGDRIAYLTRSHSAILIMNADGSDAKEIFSRSGIFGPMAWSPDSYKIAFEYDDDDCLGHYDECGEIGVINSDGSGFVRLTNTESSHRGEFAWSPDSSRIAFSHDREIYVVNANGSQQTNLTNTPAEEWLPTWSSDGSKLAFATNRDEQVEIYVMDANGNHPTRLTLNTFEEQNIAWSPDGGKILFVGYEPPHNSVHTIGGAEGGTPTKLSAHLDISAFAGSPDGGKIALLSNDLINDSVTRHLYVVDVDGSALHKLSSSAPIDDFSWSPDSQHLAIVANQGIYVVDPNASEVTELSKVTTQGVSSDVLWSPAGDQIAFLHSGDIYVVDPDGNNLRRLTTQGGFSLPAWSPTGDTLAFFGITTSGLELNTIEVTGGSLTTIFVDGGNYSSFLTWSPDGSKITYSTGRSLNNSLISYTPLGTKSPPFPPPTIYHTTYVINADGSDRIVLSSEADWVPWVTWSPDSRRLLLYEAEGITLVNPDGTNRLHLDQSAGGQPAWSPDGQRILYFRYAPFPSSPFTINLAVMRLNLTD